MDPVALLVPVCCAVSGKSLYQGSQDYCKGLSPTAPERAGVYSLDCYNGPMSPLC